MRRPRHPRLPWSRTRQRLKFAKYCIRIQFHVPLVYVHSQSPMLPRKRAPTWVPEIMSWQFVAVHTNEHRKLAITILSPAASGCTLLVIGVGNPQNLPRGNSREVKGLYLMSCNTSHAYTCTGIRRNGDHHAVTYAGHTARSLCESANLSSSR